MGSGYLSLNEAMEFLNLDKPDIEKLIKSKKLTAYKLGGAFLRFKKEELLQVKHEMESGIYKTEASDENKARKVWHFWVFNNFYILAIIMLSILFYYLLKP